MQLWADALHDLRQPVQAALLIAHTLRADARRPAQKRLAGHVAASVESLGEMIDTLSFVARIETGIERAPLRACELGEAIDAARRGLDGIAAEQSISIRFGDVAGVVRSHADLLVVVLRSLLLHALTSCDGRDVDVSCRQRGGRVVLEVRFHDRALAGSGRAPAFVELPCTRDGETGRVLGLGIGLLQHLCKRLVHPLRRATTRDGRQRLSIELPLADASPKR